ncbi:hypothetical protein [Streptomyces sp. NBC_00690]|uniref:hypothetical protein n=1 Tax=Streptomyces sp. NBC_00690 TaxID=2975808 RepID=UPI002E2B1F30|nr:hypothetical protein [Streptomyces sp. NBC_00690]
MGLFKNSNNQPSEAFAADEQHRADGLAHRIGEITSTRDHPSADSLTFYKDAYRDASTNAAAHTAQPHH